MGVRGTDMLKCIVMEKLQRKRLKGMTGMGTWGYEKNLKERRGRKLARLS